MLGKGREPRQDKNPLPNANSSLQAIMLSLEFSRFLSSLSRCAILCFGRSFEGGYHEGCRSHRGDVGVGDQPLVLLSVYKQYNTPWFHVFHDTRQTNFLRNTLPSGTSRHAGARGGI
ncbi:hypothetical protein MN608_01373 [Microdochium nivale]|nr:hypothetical protein MN608_01373 [Microdochium nivale]